MLKGNIYIISGPSGVGKGTLIREVLKQVQAKLAVSATTRPPRTGEIDGVDYFFLSDALFSLYIEESKFLEWCQVHSRKYGTLKSEVLDPVSKGQDVILEIDVQGALKVKAQILEAITIFIAPPQFETLSERLTERNTDSSADIATRLENAKRELSEMQHYDHVVVNNQIQDATRQILSIMQKRSS